MTRELAANLVLGLRHLVLAAMGGCGWAEAALFRLAQQIRGRRP